MSLTHAFIVQARRAFGGRRPAIVAASELSKSGGTNMLAPWPLELEKARAILTGLAPNTEETFLSIGTSLQSFYEASQRASDVWRAAAAAIAGEEVTQAISGLRALLDEMTETDAAQRQKSVQVVAGVTQLDRIRDQVAEFDRFSRTLRVLGVSTRIESARLNTLDSGFDRLADDVRALAADIETKAAFILERADNLETQTKSALATVQTTEERQEGRARVLSDKALASLANLSARHEAAAKLAATIAARYDEISRCIGEVVSGLQFHDIARQRIEHVIEALDVAVRDVAGRTESGESAPPAVGLVSRLQAAQLDAARAEFVGAVGRVVESLRQVAHIVAGLSSETRQAVGVLSLGTGSLADIGTNLCSVREVLGEFEGADAHLSQVMYSVADATQSMTAFMDDIRGIGQRMSFIALNACIQAEHLGTLGAPLTVISDAVHQASKETREHTLAAAATLQSIGSAAQALTSAANAGRRNSEPEQHLSVRLDRLIGMLHDADARCQDLSGKVNDTGETLSARILGLVDSIDIHERFSAAVSEALAHMETVATSSPAEDGDGAEHLKALAARYTMDQERDVHQSVFRPGGADVCEAPATAGEVDLWDTPAATFEADPRGTPAPAATSGTAPDAVPEAAVPAAAGNGGAPAADGDGLGDNVELF